MCRVLCIKLQFPFPLPITKKLYLIQLDTETEGPTRFRKLRARGCSARAQRGHYLRARRFLNHVDPVGRSV